MATLVLFLALITLLVVKALVLQGRLQFENVIPSATAEAAVLSSWMVLAQTPEKRLAVGQWLRKQRWLNSEMYKAAKAARKLARSQQSAADKAAWQAGAAMRRLLAEEAQAKLEAEAYEAWLEANPQSCSLDFRAHDRWLRKQRAPTMPRVARQQRAKRVKPVRTQSVSAPQIPTAEGSTVEAVFEVLYPIGGLTYSELRQQQFSWAKAQEERRAFQRAAAARRERREADRAWRLSRMARRQVVASADPSLVAWQKKVEETLRLREFAERKAAQLELTLAEAKMLDELTLLERKRSEAARKGWETRRRRNAAASAAGALN